MLETEQAGVERENGDTFHSSRYKRLCEVRALEICIDQGARLFFGATPSFLQGDE
jgi:hypothetical protein